MGKLAENSDVTPGQPTVVLPTGAWFALAIVNNKLIRSYSVKKLHRRVRKERFKSCLFAQVDGGLGESADFPSCGDEGGSRMQIPVNFLAAAGMSTPGQYGATASSLPLY